MTVDYPGAVDRVITDPAWVFTDALAGLSGTELSIVNHKTASPGQSTALSVADFFHNDTIGHKSAHFIIDRDGTVVQVVRLKDGAGGNCCLEVGHDPYWDTYQAQFQNLNRCTFSIEHIDQTVDNSQPMPQKQTDASCALNLWLCQRYHIPASHIKEHRSLDPVNKARCPGPTFPLAELVAYVEQHLPQQQGGTAQSMKWYEYPICVPFGNPNYDAGLGGSHDMDVKTPPNTEITALLPGTITDVSSPSWGMQVGIKLDQPYNGIPYMAHLHLAAVNPILRPGVHIKKGDVIGWSGGATSAGQYAGTRNPTGNNFVNSPDMSSQPQTGTALMRGPVYGTGAGWSTFPPIDRSLDPTPLIMQARQEKGTTTMAGVPVGWHDDGKTLTAPNGHKVVLGFRAHVLAGPWDAQDVPLEEEHQAALVEEYYPSGPGAVQTFNYTRLGYTPAKGVYKVGLGNELLGCEKALSAALHVLPPVAGGAPVQTLVDDIKKLDVAIGQLKKDAGVV